MIAKIDYNITLNRNGYVNRKGTREVVIELYQLGTRATINTHIRATEQELRNGRFQECCPMRVEYTRIIDRMVQELTRIETEIICSDRECTPRKLRDAWRNNLSRSALLRDFMESVIVPSSRMESTKNSYRTLISGLEQFRSGLRIKDISYDFIERWVNWQRDTCGMKPNTIIGRLKSLRCIMNEAIKRDVLTVDEDPFKSYTIGEMKTSKEYLTESELRRLERVKCTDRQLSHVRDAFLFCCYTGLRFGDFTSLRGDQLRNGVLTVDQLKTGHIVRIPLTYIFVGKAMAIVNRYPSLEVFADIGHNSTANRKIREVAAAAGIKKHVHWHLARHTCGTLLNQHGLQMQEIQHVLGHQRLETTERHYAATAYEQVIKSVKKAFRR
jgi:integrase